MSLSILSHRSIGLLYLSFSIFAGFIGFCFSLFIRFELGCLNTVLFSNLQEYNVLISAHGLLMVFFFIMPLVISFIGNIFIPILLLCFDLVLPRINLVSF